MILSPQRELMALVFTPRWDELRAYDTAFRQDVAFMKNLHGPSVCDELAICYRAGLLSDHDPINAPGAIALGARDIDVLRRRIGAGQYRVIALMDGSPLLEAARASGLKERRGAAGFHISTRQPTWRISAPVVSCRDWVRRKDYRIEGPDRYKTMTLATGEFIRRFLIHVLPHGFHRIRHYGLLARPACANNIARARELLAVPSAPADAPKSDTFQRSKMPACPCCGGRMLIIEIFQRGSTPRNHPEPSAAIRIETS
jgi:hypothetical protein